MCLSNIIGAALYKQKPFEYSLRMLGGLAFSTDHASRYIPLYLNSYKKTLHLLPPFLFASANCGYEIPAELESLIAHIRQKKIVADAETELKMKFFSKKMRSQAKKILKPVHAECFAAKCALVIMFFVFLNCKAHVKPMLRPCYAHATPMLCPCSTSITLLQTYL